MGFSNEVNCLPKGKAVHISFSFMAFYPLLMENLLVTSSCVHYNSGILMVGSSGNKNLITRHPLRPVASGGTLVAEASPVQIIGPLFLAKMSTFYLKKPQGC